MPEMIDVQAVIEQLMNRIAQLELEVAVLKTMTMEIAPISGSIPQEPPLSKGGYI
jgi:hypothetical protein